MAGAIIPYDVYNLQQRTRRVFYTGDDALKIGYPLCFDFDAGTAAEVDGSRRATVEKPSVTNNLHFAGVVAESKGARAGGQWVNIIEPGSPAMIYTNQNCVLGQTCPTFEAGQYRFSRNGFTGRGSAVCLQTVDRSSTPGVVMAYLMDGPESGGVEDVTPVGNAAFTMMVGGISYLLTATLGTANATATIADGLFNGMKKGVICNGTMTTNDVDLTITHHVTSDPEHLFFDAAAENWLGTWLAPKWTSDMMTAATS